MRKRSRRYKKSIIEEILYLVLKPPKWLYIAGVVLLLGSGIFGYNFFYWWVKLVNFMWLDKVMKILHDILNAVIPNI